MNSTGILVIAVFMAVSTLGAVIYMVYKKGADKKRIAQEVARARELGLVDFKNYARFNPWIVVEINGKPIEAYGYPTVTSKLRNPSSFTGRVEGPSFFLPPGEYQIFGQSDTFKDSKTFNVTLEPGKSYSLVAGIDSGVALVEDDPSDYIVRGIDY